MIPKKFQLCGQTIKVGFVKNLADKEIGVHGLASFATGEILIEKNLTREIQESTFFHEMVHYMLWVLNEHKINKNEAFVQSFGGCLHQYMKTAKFGKDKIIPELFSTFGMDITVQRFDFSQDGEAHTSTLNLTDKNVIQVMKSGTVVDQLLQLAFLTQVIHTINFYIGYMKVYRSSKLEYLLAALFQQYLRG
jgi:hypothetical protein